MTESENENDHFDLDHFDQILVSGYNYKTNTLFIIESGLYASGADENGVLPPLFPPNISFIHFFGQENIKC